jgi:hypothetical protein
MLATPLAVSLVVTGSRMIHFENLSTITSMVSYSADFGKGLIMLMDIVYQG